MTKDRQIQYWAHMLDGCRLDETKRTGPERSINAELGGIEYGFGLPDRAGIRNRIEDFVGWAETEEMTEWVRRGYVDPDIDENSFPRETSDTIRDMCMAYADSVGRRADMRGAAIAIAEAPPPDEQDDEEWDVDREFAYLQSVNDRIEEIQQDNPAFSRAPEIFLVPDRDGRLTKLIAIWCTSWSPRA